MGMYSEDEDADNEDAPELSEDVVAEQPVRIREPAKAAAISSLFILYLFIYA